MYYGMYYSKKEGKLKELDIAKATQEADDKAYELLKSLKDQKIDNRKYAQLREDYYRALGDDN